MAIEVFAPAKVNLALHVTGQRGDGYHLLDSLVVFARVGDRISVAASDTLSLRITGPEAAGLATDNSNLVLRAAQSFADVGGAALTLHKHLPVASGIGGGSADAAAALIALSQFWNRPLPDPESILNLGADLPVCLAGRATRMRGIGAQLDPLGALPAGLALVLVNPRVELSTPAVFKALNRRDNPPLPKAIPHFTSAGDMAAWLAEQRNDLQGPAVAAAPVIAKVLGAVSNTGALLARMSGSGATVFGLFPDIAQAEIAATHLRARNPAWWIAAAPVVSGGAD